MEQKCSKDYDSAECFNSLRRQTDRNEILHNSISMIILITRTNIALLYVYYISPLISFLQQMRSLALSASLFISPWETEAQKD
jgi:hypothetical protein